MGLNIGAQHKKNSQYVDAVLKYKIIFENLF